MRSPRIRVAIASASIALSLAACAGSESPPLVDPVKPADIRVTLPPFPSAVGPCLRKPFPEIPDRDLTAADTARLIGAAKILDREKSRCGRRALTWIEATRRDFAKP